MRIGIYGGTFNPPHFGHKKLALELKEKANLDKVIIIPTFVPPHKQGGYIAPSVHRIEMCKLLFTEDFFEVSDIEIAREGKSYTFDTLCTLKEIYPDDELFLIIGSDMLLCFHKWYRYEDILSMVTLCVATRQEDITRQELQNYSSDVLDRNIESDEIIIADFDPFECSSTDVRFHISLGLDIYCFVPKEIDRYIKINLLYESPYMEHKRMLREKLDDFRFYHSLCVAESAKFLALEYGIDEEKAYFAGLLHDVMKNATKEEMLQMIKKGDIILTHTEENNAKLWHSIAGSVFVKTELGIDDEEITSSIRYHTTGKAGMTTFEKVIYIADYISADRNYPDVETMRFLSVTKTLEDAALYSLQFTLKNLSEKKQVIHKDSLEFYNELVINLNNT